MDYLQRIVGNNMTCLVLDVYGQFSVICLDTGSLSMGWAGTFNINAVPDELYGVSITH